MCGRCEPDYSWHVLLEMAGESHIYKKNVHRSSHPLNDLPFIWLPFLPFFLLAFANAQMHHISLALTILPPHLFLLHAQPKSRKIAFITAAWLKGTFVNVAWSLYLPMPTSLNPPPGSRVCVSLSTCMAPPSLFSCGSLAFGIILLCSQSLFHWVPFPSRPQALMVSSSALPHNLPV